MADGLVEDPLLIFAAARFGEARGAVFLDRCVAPWMRELVAQGEQVVSKARLYNAYAQNPRGETPGAREEHRLLMQDRALTMWDAVRDLVQPFADHPDFHPHWRTDRG